MSPPPEIQLALNFLATFLVVTLLTEQQPSYICTRQKIFTTRNNEAREQTGIREPPPLYRGSIHRLCLQKSFRFWVLPYENWTQNYDREMHEKKTCYTYPFPCHIVTGCRQ